MLTLIRRLIDHLRFQRTDALIADEPLLLTELVDIAPPHLNEERDLAIIRRLRFVVSNSTLAEAQFPDPDMRERILALCEWAHTEMYGPNSLKKLEVALKPPGSG